MSAILKAVMLILNLLRRKGVVLGAAGAVEVAANLDEYLELAYSYVVDEVSAKVGISLDPHAPLSDASMAAALSSVSGMNVSSVLDVDVLKGDISAHVSGLLSDKLGVHLSDVSDVNAVRDDLLSHASGVLSAHTGLVLTNMTSQEAIERDLREFVEGKLQELVLDKLAAAADKLLVDDKAVLELSGLVRHAQDLKKVRGRDVAIGAAAAVVLAGLAMIDRRVEREVKRLKRREQNRLSQRDFRARHGNRMQYEPI